MRPVWCGERLWHAACGTLSAYGLRRAREAEDARLRRRAACGLRAACGSRTVCGVHASGCRPRAARVCCRLPFGAAAVRRLGLRAIRSRRLRGCLSVAMGRRRGRDGAAEAVNDAGLGFRTSGDPAASGSERGRSARLIGGLLEGRSDPRSGWRGGEGAVPGRRLELQRGRSASFVFGFARNRLRDASQGCYEGPFCNAPSGTQRGPCSARALPRARCGSVPRTNVSRETFSASKAEGGGIARAKRARGRGKARLPMCVQMFHVKHPVQVGRDAVVRLQAS